MSLLKTLVWVCGILWIALVVAAIRGMDWGLNLESLAIASWFGLFLGSPFYFLIYFVTKGDTFSRVKNCSKVFALGVVLGLSYAGVDEIVFSQTASAQSEDEVLRGRWWPFGGYTLLYLDGECYVLE